MAIVIKIGPGANDARVRLEMDVRKSMNGDLMIFDHGDIDIVLSTKNNKVVAFPKETMNDLVYGAQNRLFAHLRKKGLVIPESIQAGSFYGSFEATMEKKGKLGELANCPMCMGFHVGWLLMLLSPFTELFSFDVTVFNFFLLGFLSSGTSYILNMVFGDNGVKHEYKRLDE